MSEALAPGAVVAAVADRNGVCRSQLYHVAAAGTRRPAARDLDDAAAGQVVRSGADRAARKADASGLAPLAASCRASLRAPRAGARAWSRSCSAMAARSRSTSALIHRRSPGSLPRSMAAARDHDPGRRTHLSGVRRDRHDRAGRRHLARRHRAGSAASEDYLLPVPVLSRMFRGKMLAMLKAAHDAGRLQFFGPHAALADKAAFKAWLEPLYDTKWHVYAKRPFAGPEQVLAYLARYTHRVAISNSRLIGADENGVTFKFKDYRIEGPGRYKTMTRGPGRVHPPLHAARAAEGIPSHPALRAACQQQGQGRYDRAGARVDRRGGAATATAADEAGSGTCRHRGDGQADPSLPVLRWSHGHHRDCSRRAAAPRNKPTAPAIVIRIDTS